MTDIIRVLRVLEYVGPRDAVERHMLNVVHGTQLFGVRMSDSMYDPIITKTVTIRATTINPFPDVVGKEETSDEV
jgi:hypothetical protein